MVLVRLRIYPCRILKTERKKVIIIIKRTEKKEMKKGKKEENSVCATNWKISLRLISFWLIVGVIN